MTCTTPEPGLISRTVALKFTVAEDWLPAAGLVMVTLGLVLSTVIEPVAEAKFPAASLK